MNKKIELSQGGMTPVGMAEFFKIQLDSYLRCGLEASDESLKMCEDNLDALLLAIKENMWEARKVKDSQPSMREQIASLIRQATGVEEEEETLQ